MIFGSTIRSQDLMHLCRMLRVSLDAGLPIVAVFRRQATSGPWPLRSIMERVADRLNNGDTLEQALEPEKNQLPVLFTSLVVAGEETGRLTDTLRELEDYYELQLSLKRAFRSYTLWPKIQLGMAIIVITLFLLALGFFRIDLDPLGLGTGLSAALKWLMFVGIAGVIVYVVYRGFTNEARFMSPVEKTILAVPVAGPTLRGILLTRFSLGLKLTLGAGLPVKRALKLSFDATASPVYSAAYDRCKDGLRRGESIHEILEKTGVFPQDFLNSVETGEVTGNLPEVMEREARNLQEETTLRLKTLTMLASYAVYVFIAILIIIMIFRIYAVGYLGQIDKYSNQIR